MRKVDYPKCFIETIATAARDFCRLIEQVKVHEPQNWLRQADHALERLEIALSNLPANGGEMMYALAYDLDARFELYLRLKAVLERVDEYFSDTDRRIRDGFLSGSLSSNLADIYFELMRGLACFEAERNDERKAVDLWVRSYQKYWCWKLRETRKRIAETRRLH